MSSLAKSFAISVAGNNRNSWFLITSMKFSWKREVFLIQVMSHHEDILRNSYYIFPTFPFPPFTPSLSSASNYHWRIDLEEKTKSKITMYWVILSLDHFPQLYYSVPQTDVLKQLRGTCTGRNEQWALGLLSWHCKLKKHLLKYSWGAVCSWWQCRIQWKMLCQARSTTCFKHWAHLTVFITARLNYGIEFSDGINNTNNFIVEFKWIILSLFYYFVALYSWSEGLGSKTHKESEILYMPCFINNTYFKRTQFSNFHPVIFNTKSLCQNRKVTICKIPTLISYYFRIFCKDSHGLRQKSM